uniref:Rab interacting lysosomal protein dimerization domain-containing protein n=1 Tax=Eptatretus burgeri TaxID=7764 RepID=A0A8C4R3H8_EPTBU
MDNEEQMRGEEWYVRQGGKTRARFGSEPLASDSRHAREVLELVGEVKKELQVQEETHDSKSTASLLPKLMYMLELLEVFAKERKVKCEERGERRGQDPGKDEIHTGEESMKRELERLKRERELKVEAERCFIQEVEAAEECWMNEVKQLRRDLTKEREGNRLLRERLALQTRMEGCAEAEKVACSEQTDVSWWLKEKERVLKEKEREIAICRQDSYSLQLQVTRLIRLNAELRASLSRYKNERERTDRQTSNDKRKTLKDTESKMPAQKDGDKEGKRGTREQSLGLRATAKEGEQWNKRSASDVKARCSLGCKCNQCVQQDKERPRFTLSELNSVLHDRNELKAELLSLKEKANEIRTDFHQEMPDSLPSAPMSPTANNIKRLLFTAVLPLVVSGLLTDDPGLHPLRKFY